MANPLKVLTALSASAGAAISGSDGLKVQQGGLVVEAGNTSVLALTASAVSASGAAEVGGGLTVAGASDLQGVTATTVSASSTAQVGGGLTVAGTSDLQGVTATTVSASSTLQAAGDLTIGGTSTLQAVTASAISASFVTASQGLYVGGGLAIGDDLTVTGTSYLNAVTASNLSVGAPFSSATKLSEIGLVANNSLPVNAGWGAQYVQLLTTDTISDFVTKLQAALDAAGASGTVASFDGEKIVINNTGGYVISFGEFGISVALLFGLSLAPYFFQPTINGDPLSVIPAHLNVYGISTLQEVTASALSASGAGQFGGDLTVAGTSNLQAVTASALSASGAGQFGSDLTVAGVSNLQAVTASAVSASGDVQLGGDLTVGGNTIKSIFGPSIELGNASATVLGALTVGNDDGTAGSLTLRNNHATMFYVDESGSGRFEGDLSIGGTLSVAVINYSSASSITLGDKYITIASGAADHASLDGSGILLGSGGVGPTVGAFGENAHILYESATDRLDIFPGINTNALTASELHIHGTGSAAVFNGTVHIDGVTTLAEVTASALSASGALEIGGGLTVGGSSTLQAVTATTVSASSTLQAGGDLTVAGTSNLQAVNATTVSASSTLQAGGDLTIGGTSTLQAVTASALSASGALQAGGTLNVAGVSSLSAVTASGLELSAYGEGLTVKGPFGITVATINVMNGISASSNLTIAGTSTLQAVTASALSASSTLQVGGDLTVGGASILQAVTASSISASGVISGDGSGLTNLSASQLNNFAADVQAAMGGGNIVTPVEYYGVRSAVTGTVTNAGEDVLFFFSGSSVTAGVNSVTGSGLTGLAGGMNNTDIANALSFVSFDVAVQYSGSSAWTNDLVSVQATAALGGDATYYPLFTVSAPSLPADSKIRLIVVNEKAGTIT